MTKREITERDSISHPCPNRSLPDACAIGMELNKLGQCACLPLSANPDCAPPPTDPDLNNVCGKFDGSEECQTPYNVTYAVYQKNKTVATGTAQVRVRWITPLNENEVEAAERRKAPL